MIIMIIQYILECLKYSQSEKDQVQPKYVNEFTLSNSSQSEHFYWIQSIFHKNTGTYNFLCLYTYLTKMLMKFKWKLLGFPYRTR